MTYFKQAGIKMRQIDSDTNKAIDMDDVNSEEIEEEIRASQRQDDKKKEAVVEETVGRSGRRRVPVAVPQQMDLGDSYDEEDDESFGDDGDSGSDGEDGEEEMEDDLDEEEIDKDEM
jgi:hypothetical protein